MKNVLAPLLAFGLASGATATVLTPAQVVVTSSGDSITKDHTIDRSGMSEVGGVDVHNTNAFDMWLSSAQPVMWIAWEFDAPYALTTMKVWNYNQPGYQARGMRHTTIETSLDGTSWTTFSTDYQLQSANSNPSLPATDVIGLGVTARFVRFTAHPLLGSTTDPPGGYDSASGNWGHETQVGLSEVEFNIAAEPESLLVPSSDVAMTDTFGMTFDGESNKVYWLQSSPDLVHANFTNTGAIVVGNGGPMVLFDPAGPSPSMYYRVFREVAFRPVHLVEQGLPNAVIVIPADLPPLPVPTTQPFSIEFELMQSHAQTSAEILAYYILQSTGADLPIVTEDQVPAGINAIHVGDTTYARVRTPQVAQLDDDGFLATVVDAAHLVLRGATEQGTEFAVYDFLERELGVRWLFPGELGEHVPPHDSLLVFGPDVLAEPTFRSRIFRIPGDGGEWTRRNRAHSRIEFHHNMSKLIPIAWTGPHPEYFPLIDGVRRLPTQMNQQDWHLCYTIDGIVDATAQLLIGHFNAFPEYSSISLGVSDAGESGYCEHPPCLVARGTGQNALGFNHYSDMYYLWCNQVVAQVTAAHPGKQLGCLAYSEVGDPPSFPVHDNLVPYLTYELVQYVDPARRQAWNDQVDAWSNRATNFGHYEYMFGEQYIQIPRLYPHALADYCRYASDRGAVGFYAETTGTHVDTAWYAGPQAYILLRLLWDPDADVDALLADWCASAVGPTAAPHLEAYFQLWEHIWTVEMPQTAWFGTQNATYLLFNNEGYLEAVESADLDAAEAHLTLAAQSAPAGPARDRADLFLAEFQRRRTDYLDSRVP